MGADASHAGTAGEDRVRGEAMTTSDQARGQQVVRIALELQAKDKTTQPIEDFAGALRDAAVQEGLDPAYLEKAEQELKRREREALEAAATRKKGARRVVLVGAALIATLFGGWQISRWVSPAPSPPWTDEFDDSSHWSLDVNPGTHAQLRWQQEAGRGQVAVLNVEGFADSQFRVNFDGLGIPSDLSGYSELSVDVKGTLPNARVYLEAGSEERWRSPAIAVSGAWTEHRIALKSFEHQVREAGKWRTTHWAQPKGLTQSSVKVGYFINPADAIGDVYVDRLRLK